MLRRLVSLVIIVKTGDNRIVSAKVARIVR